MAKSNGKAVYIWAFLLLAGGLGYLIVSGVSQDSVYFVTVNEALAMEPSELKQARLFGTVSEKDLRRADGALGVAFVVHEKHDPTRVIKVEYRGAVPDTFKPGVEVIVEGGFDPATKVFTARTLITKCPSKYEKINEET